MNEKYTCPACGYKVFNESPGSYDICQVCLWEDDISQLRFPMSEGANDTNLKDYQKLIIDKSIPISNTQKFSKDKEWRIINLNDNFEKFESGINYGESYPKNKIELYYWKSK